MDAVLEFLNGVGFWHWLILAGLLLSLELITGTLMLIWPAAAAALVAIVVASPGPFPFPFQLALFAIVLVVFSLAGEKFIRPRWLASERPNLSSRADQLVGERARVIDVFSGGVGRVEVGGSQWPAELTDGAEPALGEWVEILHVEGATLMVRSRSLSGQTAPAA